MTEYIETSDYYYGNDAQDGQEGFPNEDLGIVEVIINE